jgi:DNA-binding CsgD family transcriptional regulator
VTAPGWKRLCRDDVRLAPGTGRMHPARSGKINAEARDGFERLGAKPWAERAREELRAVGERSNLPVADAWDALSPQEVQIASMVIQGLTNREVGERLFISYRTVGSHLYRMFPKLGISSRTELLRLAAERERASTA